MEDPHARADCDDSSSILHEEIELLPRNHRAPVVLCYLQGKTYDEAAALLGCPKGTLATRLSAARERLRCRLSRRGVTVSGALLGTLLAGSQTKAGIPSALVGKTVAAASGMALTRPVLSGLVAELVRETLQEYSRRWAIRVVLGVLLVLGGIGGIVAGIGSLRNQPAALPDRPDRDVSIDELIFAAAPWEGKDPAIAPADQAGFDGVAPRDPRKFASGTTPWGVRWNFDPATSTMTIDGTQRSDGIILRKDTDGTLLIDHYGSWLPPSPKGHTGHSITDTNVPLGTARNIILNGGKGNDALLTDELDQRTDFAQVVVNGGPGNDVLYHRGPSNLPAGAGDVILNGDAGDDWIYAYGSEVSADGGAGRDFLRFAYANLTRIRGGIGQDEFVLNSVPYGASTDPADYIPLLPDNNASEGDVFRILFGGVR